MKTLGISAYYHDSAAAITDNGVVLAACQEERFTRLKNDARFPTQAIRACLKASALDPTQIESIVFFEKPFLKFERLIETYLATAPMGWKSFRKSMPLWLSEKLFQRQTLGNQLRTLGFSKEQCENLLFSEHHLSHAASAFFPSPFRDAVIVTIDGVGEWATTSVWAGRDSSIEKVCEIQFPHSVGMLYSAFTSYCGFRVNSGEYKLMGLAPFGEPLYVDKIFEHLIDLKEDGSFALDMKYFNFAAGLTMTSHRFHQLFGGEPRLQDEPITQRHKDLAASAQAALNRILLTIVRSLKLRPETKDFENLCLAGGVALNCVSNSKILESKLFKKIWIAPAAGDAGGAIGAALAATHIHFGAARTVNSVDGMSFSLLGAQSTPAEIESTLRELGAVYTRHAEDDLVDQVTNDIAQGLTVGWFQGRMEFGPRALGARSILADPRRSDMQSRLNRDVKFRELFRPFAPAVLAADVTQYFDFKEASPYMLFTAKFKAEHLNPIKYPAVTHVDSTARIQTVTESTSPIFYKLLKAFKALTGSGMLLNTSFNVRGEPIVESVEDAFTCFMTTGLDRLAIGPFYLDKSAQTGFSSSKKPRNFQPD